MKVDFIIVGAQKSGTTTLSRILEQHASISFCNKKEPNFWCSTTDWERDIDAYHQRFESKEGVLYGEASTSYTFHPLYNMGGKRQIKMSNSWSRFSANMLPFKVVNVNIVEDLFEYNPQMKFIYIVRNPYERIISAYKHFYHRAYVNSEINQAVVDNSVFLDISRYYTQIKPYIDQFGRDNVLLLDFEKLKTNQKEVRESLSDFLELPTGSFIEEEDLHANKSSKFRPPYFLDKVPFFITKILTQLLGRQRIKANDLTPETKKIIRVSLSEEVTKIGELMNQDLSHWFE